MEEISVVTEQKSLHVVAGIIFNEHQKILISRRPLNKTLGGYWEFPGGKLELGESAYQTLQRELFEEINLNVMKAKAWKKINYVYPDMAVTLDLWKVESFNGDVKAMEGQDIAWVSAHSLEQYLFAPANQEVIKELMHGCI